MAGKIIQPASTLQISSPIA